MEPPLYVYVAAPPGTIVNDWPEQTDPLLTVTVGTGFTVNDTAVLTALTVQVAASA